MDGLSWSSPQPAVASPVVAYRPGMANVRVLSTDPYLAFMTYDVRVAWVRGGGQTFVLPACVCACLTLCLYVEGARPVLRVAVPCVSCAC